MEDRNKNVIGNVPPFHTVRIKQEIMTEDSSEPTSSLPGTKDISVTFPSIKVNPETSRLDMLQKSLSHITRFRAVVEVKRSKMKAAYKLNLERQAIAKKILKDDTEAKLFNERPPSQVRAISVFAAPYFRDVKKMVPPDNEDTQIKRKNHDVNAYLKPPRPWSKPENKKLLDGVTSFALMSALKPWKVKRDFLKNKLKKDDLLDFEIKILEKQLKSTEKKIATVSKSSLPDLLRDIHGKIDWMTISAVNMEGTRTPEECENMYNNVLDFSINKGTFTKEEDKTMEKLAKANKERNWDKIAKDLKTNRTAIQCFERYQKSISTTLKKKFWTKEEDAKLVELINEYKCGEGDIIPWNKISLEMDGRTRQQCINRYERSISQVNNRAPWTTEEDALLLACYHKYGVHWADMKDFFQRRSTYAIRERYVNALDPDLKMGSWTKEEDRLLISLIKQYGWGKWSKICKKITGRTDNMCLVRAGRLLDHSVKDKDAVEYDLTVYDPELFAKILKPVAPTKVCTYRNVRLKNYRKHASETLLNALEKVLPGFQAQRDDPNTLNLPYMSRKTLQLVSEQLQKEIDYTNSIHKKSVYRYKKNYDLRERKFSKDFEDFVDEEEVNVPDCDKKIAELALCSMLQMKNNIIHSSINKKPFPAYTSRELAEVTIYKAYLSEKFECLNICDEEDENVNFSGLDYADSLHNVIPYFIQPPIYENQSIVLVPNMTTMLGMETLEVTEDRLQSMSQCVSHSKGYIDYLCNRRKSCPKCLKCLYKNNEQGSSQVSAELLISNMKNKSFIVDKTLEESAYVEAGLPDKSVGDCSCSALQESYKSIQLLRKRFMSLFLWPALLASTEISQIQENMICEVQAKPDYFKKFTDDCMSASKSDCQEKKPVKRRRRRAFYRKPRKASSKKSVTSLKKSNGQSNVAAVSNAEGEKSPKERRQYKRKAVATSPEKVRRSKRRCVLNRSTFAYEQKDHEKKQELIQPE